MRWTTVGLCVLTLAAGAGCMGAFGQQGRLGRAMNKDLRESYLQQRTCPKEIWNQICAEDAENGDELSEDCIEACFE
jgi:deferrochelatase/peroxidase EfeB